MSDTRVSTKKCNYIAENMLYVTCEKVIVFMMVWQLFSQSITRLQNKNHHLLAFNPRMTEEVKPESSISFNPLMVIPPGVVTLSISVSGLVKSTESPYVQSDCFFMKLLFATTWSASSAGNLSS